MNRKILLVDDEQDILDTLKKLLEAYPVISACSGPEALKLIEAQKPALVLLDVAMQDMNGVAVLEKVMLMDEKPVVLMLTADGTLETAAKTLAMGAFAYITKPFDSRQIIEMVVKAFAFIDKKVQR